MVIIVNSVSNDSWVIRGITVEEALPIRHSVLWPNKSQEECRVEGDECSEHFGVFIEEKLVCVASIFIQELSNAKLFSKKEKSARLRKFATIEEYQGKGIGSFVLKHIIDLLQQQRVRMLWCDAREDAMSLYKRFGMNSQDERFFKGDIPYQKMVVMLAM